MVVMHSGCPGLFSCRGIKLPHCVTGPTFLEQMARSGLTSYLPTGAGVSDDDTYTLALLFNLHWTSGKSSGARRTMPFFRPRQRYSVLYP